MSDEITRLPVKCRNRDDKRYLQLLEGLSACCHTEGVIVDERSATVECSACGERLNPMWVLAHLAREETRWHHFAERYQEQMKRLGKRLRTKCVYCGRMTEISRR